MSRLLLPGVAALLWSCTDPRANRADPADTEAARSPSADAIALGARPLSVDERGIPNLLRGGDALPAMSRADATSAARMHVERLAPAWGVRSTAMPGLEALGEISVAGGTIVRFRQVIDGMPVATSAGGEIRVMVRGDGTLVGASGRLVASDTPHGAPAAMRFVDDDAGAVARTVSDLYRTPFAPAMLAMAHRGSDGARMLSGESGSIRVWRSRARKAWVPDGSSLTPAWVVEAYAAGATSTDLDAVRTVIAADGRVLSRTDLKEHAAFSYRVFADSTGELQPFDGPIDDVSPHPTGIVNTTPFPAFIAPNLVTVEGLNHAPGPGGTTVTDPWLADGQTETIGNNVDAFTNTTLLNEQDTDFFRADTTGDHTFDRSYDFSRSPNSDIEQRKAGITSLFFLVNYLHDIWYDAGFTEAAGNAQTSNLGRGGEDGDAMLARTQTWAARAARNNSNMSTPDDGFPPRLNVYLWDGRDTRSLSITTASGTRMPPTGRVRFGPPQFTVTAEVVYANDGGPYSGEACAPIPDATGKIVLVWSWGHCSLKAQVLNVQNAHGVAVIAHEGASFPVVPPTIRDDPRVTTPITIGVVSITQPELFAIRRDLAGTVTATIMRDNEPELEGAFDATVVAHEFGHFLYRRLTSCRTALCGAMSEGWGDFTSLLLMSRAGDDFQGAFAIGTPSRRGFDGDPVYFGGRRAPYSANHDIDPRTYRHMASDQVLTAGTPEHPVIRLFPNSDAYLAGEVWASMLWEGYAALQQQAGAVFEQVRRRMQQYVVAGLLMAPPDATPTETRDAILLVARAASPADADVLSAAYARRGFGLCAVSPQRTSSTFIGIVESTATGGRFATGPLARSWPTRCDTDEILDNGETVEIEIPITNTGWTAMHDVAATVTSALPGVHIAKPTVEVGTIEPGATATAKLRVELDALEAPTPSDLAIEISSDDACRNITVSIDEVLHSDDLVATSTTDTFEASASVWAATHVPQQSDDIAELWTRVRKTASDALWYGADPRGRADASLTSPPLEAGPGDLTLTFTHAFSFAFSPSNIEQPYDWPYSGGAIEYTTDAGATWKDVRALVPTTPYNHVLDFTNPLSNRMAFGGKSASYPAMVPVTLDFGSQLANQTFQIRFRIGTTDKFGRYVEGREGWSIDNIAFTGLVGTPFPAPASDTGSCPVAPSDPGGCCDAGRPFGGNIVLCIGVLIFLRRRQAARAEVTTTGTRARA